MQQEREYNFAGMHSSAMIAEQEMRQAITSSGIVCSNTCVSINCDTSNAMWLRTMSKDVTHIQVHSKRLI